jgi:hypothetical protein
LGTILRRTVGANNRVVRINLVGQPVEPPNVVPNNPPDPNKDKPCDQKTTTKWSIQPTLTVSPSLKPG